MVTLAFVSEDNDSLFDVIHSGEDLYFLKDGFVYVIQHFVLEAHSNCKSFKTFQAVYHGKVCNINDSQFTDLIRLDNHGIDGTYEDRFILFNKTFLNEDNPSNKGFEGLDFECTGRNVSFDDYNNINVPSLDDFKISLNNQTKSHSVVNFEFKSPISQNQRFAVRFGFLIEPLRGKAKRFILYPPEIDYNFDFYTKRIPEAGGSDYLTKLNNQGRIMDLRLSSPKNNVPTCDFFFLTEGESIDGLLAPSKVSRMPFSTGDFSNGLELLSYHLYPEDLANLTPTKKEIIYNDEKIDVQVLKFGNNSPVALKIYRADKALIFMALSLPFAMFGAFNSINVQYNLGYTIGVLTIFSLILTIISLIVLNKMITKNKV